MSGYFELDVNKYSLDEIKKLLSLSESYSLEEVIQSENCMRQHLLADGAVDSKKKNDIISFLKSIKERLLQHIPVNMNSHDIIQREHANVKYLNPIVRPRNGDEDVDRSTIKRLICVDSEFRDNYYDTLSTNFHFTLPTVVKNVISMELAAIEIPSTYYQVSREFGNDYFWLFWNTAWYFIAVPEGNYTKLQIVTVINEHIAITIGLTASEPRPLFLIDMKSGKSAFVTKASPADTPGLIKLAFNRKRGNLISTIVGSTSPLPEIDLGAQGGIMGKLGWMLGFRLAEYTNAGGYASLGEIGTSHPTDISGGGYISEGVYNDWLHRYFYIVVDDFNKNSNNFVVPIYAASLGNPNILARIAVNPSMAFQNGGYTLSTDDAWNDKATKRRDYFGPVDITKIRFQILDGYGRVLNLNNMDCSFALNLVCLYDY